MKHRNSKYTPKERALLARLWNASRTRSNGAMLYGELIEVIKPKNPVGASKLLTVYIRNLRRKMCGSARIINVRNVGYFLKPPPKRKKMGKEIDASDEALFGFFKASDGRIITADQVALFIQTKGKTLRSRRSVATSRIVKLRGVLPQGHSIVAFRGVGYSLIVKPLTVPAAQSVISGEVSP